MKEGRACSSVAKSNWLLRWFAYHIQIFPCAHTSPLHLNLDCEGNALPDMKMFGEYAWYVWGSFRFSNPCNNRYIYYYRALQIPTRNANETTNLFIQHTISYWIPYFIKLPRQFFFFRFNMYGNNQAKHTVPFLGSFTMMGSKLYGGVNFRRKSNPAPWVLCVLLRVWYWCYFWRFGYFRVCLKQTLNIDTLLDLFLWVMNLAIWDVIERHLSQWERRIDLLFRTIFAHSMMPFGVFLV